VIQAGGAAVESGVIALSTPNHPLRLAGFLAASLAFFAIVATAVYAVTYVVQDQRSGRVSEVLGTEVTPKQSDLHLPPGVIALQRVDNESEFKQLAGFKPFIPKELPENTQHDLSLSVALPDDNGVRTGRVGYSPKEDAAVDGITGPMVVLLEVQGKPGDGVDGELKRVTSGNGRALVATIGCRDLVIDVQLYFGPDPQPGKAFLTPYMTDTAQKFLDGVKRQCGE
jgi:hypothetical protein